MTSINRNLIALSAAALIALPMLASAQVSAGLTSNTSGSVTTTVVPVKVDATVNADVSAQSAASSSRMDMNVTSTAVDLHVKNTVSSDTSFTGGSASNNEVSISYNEKGNFLGIIPVTVSTTASADASGNVKVTHPWYDFLTFSNDTDARVNLQSQLSSYAASQGSDGTFSDAAKVSTFDALHAAVKAWMSSRATVDN